MAMIGGATGKVFQQTPENCLTKSLACGRKRLLQEKKG